MLRYYQKEAVDNTIAYLVGGGQSAVIALPTGSGKSIVIAELINRLTKDGNKILVVSHVKEILEQNYDEIKRFSACEPTIYSAMIGIREISDVTVAGIQSIYRKGSEFSRFDIILIDECHRVSQDEGTMYQKFLSSIGEHKMIGLSATPYRLGTGYIYGKGKMFEKCTCDYTSSNKFVKLIDDGFLCPLTVKRTKLEMDTSGIKLVAGDFNEKQLSEKFDRESVTNDAIKEIMAAGSQRKHWLIFAIDIDHANHISEKLIRNGISALPVHSKMMESGFERGKIIEGFKNGTYRCIVNVNILTTGFNFPGVDLICMLRPTNSPALHTQSLGRGCRTAEKENCLVLDFAGNSERLGAVNDVHVTEAGKGAEGGDPITKTCPDCSSIVAPAVRICPDCGHKFSFQHKLRSTAADFDVIERGGSKWLGVDSVTYKSHSTFGKNSVEVSYKCGSKVIREWICVEHSGFAKSKADHWVKYRGGEKCDKVSELIAQAERLKRPSKILVSKKNGYFVINDAAIDRGL